MFENEKLELQQERLKNYQLNLKIENLNTKIYEKEGLVSQYQKQLDESFREYEGLKKTRTSEIIDYYDNRVREIIIEEKDRKNSVFAGTYKPETVLVELYNSNDTLSRERSANKLKIKSKDDEIKQLKREIYRLEKLNEYCGKESSSELTKNKTLGKKIYKICFSNLERILAVIAVILLLNFIKAFKVLWKVFKWIWNKIKKIF